MKPAAAPDHNARDATAATPLHMAAWNDKPEAVALLLEAGADPSARDAAGRILLHIAAREGDPEAIAALVDGGADPNARDGCGRHDPVRLCGRQRGAEGNGGLLAAFGRAVSVTARAAVG